MNLYEEEEEVYGGFVSANKIISQPKKTYRKPGGSYKNTNYRKVTPKGKRRSISKFFIPQNSSNYGRVAKGSTSKLNRSVVKSVKVAPSDDWISID